MSAGQEFVMDYMVPRTMRIPAPTLEDAGKVAKSWAEKEKVKLLSVKTADQWAADEVKRLQGESHG